MHTTESARLDRLINRRHAELLAEETIEQSAFHLDDIDALRLGVNARQARDVGAVIDSIWGGIR